MNILLDKLPQITPNGYKINTDFRNGIRFELLMQDNTIEDRLKLTIALNIFYDEIPHDVEKALDDIIWFYRMNKNEKVKTKPKENKKSKQIYSFEFDDVYIYSAFLQQYKINLNSIDYLHWWEFKALIEGLNDDTQFVKIMGYRAIDLGKIKDKDEKNRYKELQKLYALPDMRTEEQKEADFGRAFW